jgi:hypothetical protein
MRAVLFACLLFLPIAAFADESGRPTGENCNLSSPPDSAGETLDHGVTLKIFPRARDLGTKYSGCQGRWVADKKGWRLSSLVVIKDGLPMRLWKPEVSFVTCIYDKGKVVLGDPKSCPDQRELILASRAAGCLDRIQRTIAQGGNPSPQLPGCDPE